MQTQNPHYLLQFQQLASLRDALVILKFKLQNELEYNKKFKNPEVVYTQSELDRVQKLLDDTKIGKLECVIKDV